jgi:hypothetical protein
LSNKAICVKGRQATLPIHESFSSASSIESTSLVAAAATSLQLLDPDESVAAAKAAA